MINQKTTPDTVAAEINKLTFVYSFAKIYESFSLGANSNTRYRNPEIKMHIEGWN
jgi:hypothetical protein